MKILEDALKNYLEYCRYERAFSPFTCQAYARDCQNLLDYLIKNEISLATLHEAHIQAWLSQAHAAHQSPRTLARALASVRGFFKFCIKHHVIDKNPTTSIHLPKSTQSLPKTLDVDQIQALLDAPEHNDLDCRDLAILELFYSSGLRLSELVACDLPDLDFQSGLIRITGKGSKTRIVPVGKKAIERLQAWLKIRTTWVSQNNALFISKQGKRLTPRAIQKRVHQLGQKQGLVAPLHPHQLRHSVASHLLESSQDLRAVQEFLGHANLSTTQIYTALDFQHLAEVYDKTHPRAKKKE